MVRLNVRWSFMLWWLISRSMGQQKPTIWATITVTLQTSLDWFSSGFNRIQTSKLRPLFALRVRIGHFGMNRIAVRGDRSDFSDLSKKVLTYVDCGHLAVVWRSFFVQSAWVAALQIVQSFLHSVPIIEVQSFLTSVLWPFNVVQLDGGFLYDWLQMSGGEPDP